MPVNFSSRLRPPPPRPRPPSNLGAFYQVKTHCIPFPMGVMSPCVLCVTSRPLDDTVIKCMHYGRVGVGAREPFVSQPEFFRSYLRKTLSLTPATGALSSRSGTVRSRDLQVWSQLSQHRSRSRRLGPSSQVFPSSNEAYGGMLVAPAVYSGIDVYIVCYRRKSRPWPGVVQKASESWQACAPVQPEPRKW